MSATAVAAISDEERRKKSVYYETCTSPFKDDFPTLVKCLRSPEPGNPHTRQEAGFLLWHHALGGDDPSGLVSAGLLTACVANLDSTEVLLADKACSAGILLALACDDEEVAEQLLKVRSPSGRTSLEVLHAVVYDDAALARQYCSRLLQSLARQVAPSVLRAMDNQLPYLPTYLTVWAVKEHRDAVSVAALVEMLQLLLEQRPELAPSVVSAGGVDALMDLVRSHKSEAAVGAALHCLMRLLAVEAAQELFICCGGIDVLVDVMGPPPKVALENRTTTIQEEEDEGEAPRAPEPPQLSAAAAAAAAWRRTPQADEDAEYSDGGLGNEAGEDAAGGNGGGGGGTGGDGAGGRDSDGEGLAAATVTAAATDPGLDADGISRTSSELRSPKGLSWADLSPTASSPRTAGATAAAGGGGGGGASGWSSARTSHRSLGSHGSTSLQARVQLPLVIPGLHSAASAAGGGLSSTPSGNPVMGSLGSLPSSHQHASSRTLRLSLSQGADRAASTADGGAEAAAAAAAAGDGDGGGGAGTNVGGGNPAAAAPLSQSSPPPALPTAADLATNRSGLRWILLPGLEVASRAAACLTLVLMHRPGRQVEAEVRLASHRILAQLKAVMGPKIGGGGRGAEGSSAHGKKATKKKGLGLTAEQTAALGRLLGLLKFLSLHNTTRYRIANLGAVPQLVRLYGEANDYLLRNHCQAILANVALLAENGVALRDAKMPEEFLVSNPMRLTAYERAVLRIEFPEDPQLLARR